MGVLNLWQILGPVQQHQELSELKGQVLAVDLSIWVCETQCVKQMQGIVSKPFLRNLFFRILHLLQLGVHLVFVVEGEAPDLKKDIMCKRQEARFHSKPQGFKGQGPRGSGGKGSRRNFNACLRECCRMLDCLGVPYLHSYGEAEALCAALDAAGLVDGCLTNDGDAFLYGARTVYRNFTMNTKDPHVESYSMSSIESRLGLDRQKMVAIALLLGCDYLPKGVPGVGVDKATKLLTTLQGYSILDRFHKWRQMSDGECVDPIESLVRKKALALPDFPQIPVITEFLTSKDKCPSAIKSWSRPQIAELQKFALDKMEWVVEYTLEKVLPLVTLWDMTFICKQGHSSDRLLQPLRVVKSRTRQGVHCYEVEWNKPESDTLSPQAVYTTIETQDLFSKCYPELVQEFEKLVAAKVTKGKSRKKKDVEHDSAVVKSSQNLDEDLCEAVGNLSLTTDTRGSQPSRGGSSSLGRKVEKERIQQENVKLLTQQLRDTEKEIRYSTHDDVKLNEQESHTASMVKGTASQQEGKLKVTPEVTVDRYNNSKIKLPDFTSDLSLHTRRNTEEHNRKAITVDMCEKKVQGTEKQNRVPDINRRSEVSTAVMISKQDTGVTEEECSDDEEEQAYIPLSQRVQINLKVALKKKHKASTKAKNFSIRSENLDVSGLCTMLGSVKGSQQLPTKLAITSTQPDQDTEGMCDKVEAHLPNPVTSTSRGVSKEQDKDKMMSDKSCTLGTAQKSYPDKTLLNVEGVRQTFKDRLYSRLSVKSVNSVKSRRGRICLKEQKSCVENQDLQHCEILTKEENTKLFRLGTVSTREEDIQIHNRNLVSGRHVTDGRQETRSVVTVDTPLSSNNSSMDSYSVSGIEQLTPRKLVDVMDTEVMAPPSGSRVTHGQQGTVQINLPDISKLSPSVSRNLNSSPNCSQDLFNLTDFSCVEKINFTISTPTPCRTCNHQMSCRSDHSMSTPISNSNQHHLNNCGPVQETPCTTEMQANCHRPVIDEKSLTESPHSVLHYNESLNLTGNQSVTEFGNFQIESSILRNMDRSHQVSADQSQDISSLGDLSHNYSSSLGKNDTPNQDIVLQKFETKGQPPDAFLKKTCVSDYSHLLSTDTECKEVQGHHYPGYRDQEECLAGCVHGGADGHEDASYNTRLDGNNKGSMSCSPQYTAKSPDSQSNPGHHSSGYTSMDDSVAFKFVDSKGDHLPSTENVKGDRVKLQGLASLTTHRTASLLDIGGKHRNKPDVRSESHTNYPQCTSGHLVSKYSSEPASTAQCTVRAGNRHTDTLDRRLEGKLTSHVASVSVPLPSIKQVTDELLIGKDSVISTSSYTPVVKNVSDRTSPDLHKEHARRVVNKVISVSVDIDHSPVALADRLRARLRKASDHSVLGDIRDNRHNIGTIGSEKQERTTILID